MLTAIGCSQITIIKRIDKGKLPAYRLPQGGRHRRCLKSVFRRYLKSHGILSDVLDEIERRAQLRIVFRRRNGHG
jgi:hypothetical protein